MCIVFSTMLVIITVYSNTPCTVPSVNTTIPNDIILTVCFTPCREKYLFSISSQKPYFSLRSTYISIIYIILRINYLRSSTYTRKNTISHSCINIYLIISKMISMVLHIHYSRIYTFCFFYCCIPNNITLIICTPHRNLHCLYTRWCKHT